MIAEFLPDGISPLLAIALVVASFFTSATSAAFGVGGGLTLLSIMAYILPPLVLIPVHGVVQLGSNAGRAWLQRSHIEWPRILPFLIGCIAGITLGSLVAIQLPTDFLRIVLALFILILVWIKFPALKNAGAGTMTAGGVSTAFVTMFAGATGPLVAVFFKDIFSDRKVLVAMLSMSMTFQHLFKVIAFTVTGFAFVEWLPLIGAMVLSGYAGTNMGISILNRFDEKLFRKVFKIVLTLIALDLLRRAFLALA